jgi:hypothetical protein
MDEHGARHVPQYHALMLSLGLVATVQAKAQKDTVQMDAFTPVSEQIRRVETAMGSEDYSEIGLEDKSRVQQALNRIRIKMNGREKVDELARRSATTCSTSRRSSTPS